MGLRGVFLFVLLVFSWGVADAEVSGALDFKEVRIADLATLNEVPITDSKIPVALERSCPLCAVCENVTAEAVKYLSDKQTQDEIIKALHAVCSQTLYFEQKCVELVDSCATRLFCKIAEIQPLEFCKQYGLCRDGANANVLRSESTCVFCHHVVDEILSKLKDPDAEFEILQMLLKECNNIEGHVQQCKRLVLQYVPLILVNGEKFLEKNDVCAVIHVCEGSEKRSIRLFSEEDLLHDA